MAWWFKTPLWVRILVAMALGVALGFALRPESPLVDAAGLDAKAWTDALKLVGDAFVRLIRMLAAPLIFVSVTAAVVSMADLSKLGSSGARVTALYVPSSLLASATGIGIALLFQPGAGGTPPAGITPPEPKAPPTPADIVNQIIPANPVQALANGDMLSIIFFALLFGAGLLGAGAASKPAADAIDGAGHALSKVVGYIMEFAPVGAFALMAWVVAIMGAEALVRLSALVGSVYVACLLYAVVVYGGFIRLALNLPALPFFRGMGEAVAVAYATSSSAATLPVTLKCMIERLGISRRMSGFVAALGSTVNMDGTALYLALLTVFGAQLFGVQLDGADYLAIMVTATLGSVGAAGIPGGSVIFMPIVFGAVGVPLELIAIVLGVDRLMDMMRTTLNVLGDAAAAVAVAKWEGELDVDALQANRPAAA